MKSINELPGNRNWIIAAGILGFAGVALGAFGAHGLSDILTPKMLETFRTGVLYHLIHTAVITVIAFSGDRRFNGAALFMLIGIILFSFSLYIYTTTGVRWLAMVTPFGGLSFLAGWAMIIWGAVKK